MNKIFLSYTYQSHTDHSAEIDSLQRTVRRVIESMDLRVVDGMDLGGRPLDAEIDKRIGEADAMIALVTPQSDESGNKVLPEFVISEYQTARTLDKPRIRVLHDELAVRGLGSNEEHTRYTEGNTLDVVMKLLGTIAIWKKELGRSVQIRVEPDDLVARYDSRTDDSCEYELMVQSGQAKAKKQTTLWREPGGPQIHVPDYIDGARVRVQLTVGGERWESPFVSPQLTGIELTKS